MAKLRYFNYLFLYFIKSKLVVITSLLLITSGIVVQAIIQAVFNNISTNILINSYLYIYVLIHIFIFTSLISIFTFLIFNRTKYNGIDSFILISPIPRKAIFNLKLLFILLTAFIFALTYFLISLLLTLVISDNTFAFINITMLGLDIFIIIIFIGFGVIVGIYFKPVIATIIMTLFILVIPGSFILSRNISMLPSNNLQYNQKLNYNNYFKIFERDNDKIKNEKLGIIIDERNVDKFNHNNSFTSLNAIKGSAISSFMPGEIFSQFSSDILLAMNPINFSDNEKEKVANEDYRYNTTLLNGKKYGNGDPSILDVNKKYFLISYQHENPFMMSYDQIKSKITKLIFDNKDLFKQDIINSLLKKLSSSISWNNISLVKSERNLLELFSGVNKNHWLYYIWQNIDIFKRRLLNLRKDLKILVSKEANEFFSYIWNGDSYKNNLLSYKTIYSSSDIKDNFPDIRVQSNLKRANEQDIEFFKNDLIHWSGLKKDSPRILNNKNVYIPINVSLINKIDNNIKTKDSWISYIEQNNEINNLKNVYSQLQSEVQEMSPSYNFEPNTNDIYAINKVGYIETKPWINYSILKVFILIGISGLLLIISKITNIKKAVKNVQ